jgi:hypothetical protein
MAKGKSLPQLLSPLSVLPDCPVVTRDGTQDGSPSANQTLTGPDYHNTFYFDIDAVSGQDRITNFAKDDVLATSKKLHDGNGDGIITFGFNGKLDFDGPDAGTDTVKIDGINPAKGLRYLGESCEDVHVYADATVRPLKAKEGSVADSILTGDAANAKKDVFFWDTALDIFLGDDKIQNFGKDDLLVTTTQIFDSNGDNKIGFGFNKLLDLPGGVGGPSDPGLPGEVGTVGIKNTAGQAVLNLEYDGLVTHNSVNYYVYSGLGTAAGTGDLLFS